MHSPILAEEVGVLSSRCVEDSMIVVVCTQIAGGGGDKGCDCRNGTGKACKAEELSKNGDPKTKEFIETGTKKNTEMRSEKTADELSVCVASTLYLVVHAIHTWSPPPPRHGPSR